MKNSYGLERILWSIALPGFGQFLNKKPFKGIILLSLEFIINNQSNLNEAIISSFQGNIQLAIEQTNYQWLMFYPCVYLFAIWDAYRDTKENINPFSFLPFVFSAYVGTIGVIFSTTFTIGNTLLGPIWLPIIFLFLGAGLGGLVRSLLKAFF